MLKWAVLSSPLVLYGFSQPAECLILIGLSVFAWSVYWDISRMCNQPRDHDADPGRALTLVQGFRIGITGLCLAGVGAGWLWDSRWLFGLSLIIGGEELLESSVIIKALKESLAGKT